MDDKLKVKDLIEKLKEFDENLPLKTHFSFGDYSYELEYISKEKSNILKDGEKTVLLCFESMRKEYPIHHFD